MTNFLSVDRKDSIKIRSKIRNNKITSTIDTEMYLRKNLLWDIKFCKANVNSDLLDVVTGNSICNPYNIYLKYVKLASGIIEVRLPQFNDFHIFDINVMPRELKLSSVYMEE